MDEHEEAFNFTDGIQESYPVANMIFQNKTLILITRPQHSSSQQMALLAGMAFIGGVVAGLLIRCLYFGVVRFFIDNVDHLTSAPRAEQGNANPSYVDDHFRLPNDEPPDYGTVMTEVSTHPVRPGPAKSMIKVTEEIPPPPYLCIVSNLGEVRRVST